jgi:thioredoxin reductase (NADPH)
MSKIASKVILIEAESKLTATPVLQDRVFADPKIEVLCGTAVESVIGNDKVEAVEIRDLVSKKKGKTHVDGVLVHIGLEPNTGYLEGVVPLDHQGRIIVNERMETEIPNILAAGDVRSGSPRQVVTAVGDGAMAAITAQGILQESEPG